MAQITYEFRPPVWRPRTNLHAQTGTLLLGSAVWAVLCVGIGWYISRVGFVPGSFLTGTLVFCVVWSVVMGLAWRRMWRRWRNVMHTTLWPALSREQSLALSPSDFEAYVAQRLFTRQGYAVENVRDVKDGGIDIVVTDRAGRRAVVQCKRYRGTVGESIVRDLYGTMIHDGATMAFLVTTGTISQAARRWAAGKPIDLIDGERLAELANAEPVDRNR